MLPSSPRLPVEEVRSTLLAALAHGPVVLSAPTGSGKSTAVPRWLAEGARVLVVEPRRMACRALAARVAELEGSELGDRVGYVVRDDRRAGPRTQIQFVTPGVALRMWRKQLAGFDVLVLDEFHERGQDTDLLLALASRQQVPLVVLSATIQGDRIADHLRGTHVRAEGRRYPVEIEYLADDPRDLPSDRHLPGRVRQALRRLDGVEGDVLVFLPGKGEIAAVRTGLSEAVLTLHGGLSLAEQIQVLRPGKERRVILATNVAETSLTIPGIGAVIDTGLVRRTRYHDGRGHLALGPVALDSADQRSGRAGRLGPGRCVRLWGRGASLEPVTPPAIHRESLVDLVLASIACDADPGSLPWLDPPRPYALEAATHHLEALGATEGGTITATGRRLFGLPLDPFLGRLLVQAKGSRSAHDVVDLVAALSVDSGWWTGRPPEPDDDLRASGCDAEALIRAVREGDPTRHCLVPGTLQSARRTRHRLVQALDLSGAGDGAPDRRALARCLIAAWPRCAHIVRRRKRQVAWSNGGTELSLGRDSAVDEEKTDAALVLDSRAFGGSSQERRLMITAAMPVPTKWLVEAELGEELLALPLLKRGRVLARTERVYAGRVLQADERPPTGALAREAVRDLILQGRLREGLAPRLVDRYALRSLAAQLDLAEAIDPVAAWLLGRLEELGLETDDDLALLEDDDLLPAPLPYLVTERLRKEYPQQLDIGDAQYRITYEVRTRTATLHQHEGNRKDPPPPGVLPRLPGWQLKLERRNRVTTLRGRTR